MRGQPPPNAIEPRPEAAAGWRKRPWLAEPTPGRADALEPRKPRELISARHCRGRGRHQPGAKADPRAGLDRCRIAVGKGDADPEAGMLALIDQRDPRHASPDKPLEIGRASCRERVCKYV